MGVVSEYSLLVVGREQGNRGVSTVRSHYQASAGEEKTDLDDSACAIVICRACSSVRVLKSFVITSYERSLN